MKLINTLLTATFILSTTVIGAAKANAAGSVQHSAQASKHSALAVTEGVASTAKVASVAVAAPLIVTGGISLVTGSVIAQAADSIKSNHGSHKHADKNTEVEPLVISDTTVTVDPAPNQVIIIQNNNTQG
ncbi:hypothetical protein FX988_03299 [Paraglaciecola mesophila]|uniref:Uncharacterized protein n=1 Tax=Paraglaciecola mesophila TaxID=197222 RepID=A0A857JPR5_9ALTE|nr:hypothetical protein [Paraglaciecola mesophila]QHJ13041.1 hypothetical protein FX988_03299 [Paraglaciecola mesophila]